MASDEHHNNELAAQSKLTALYQVDVMKVVNN